jgi:hypothetical protein
MRMVMRVAITDRPPMMDGHYRIKQRTDAQRIQELKEFRSSSRIPGEPTLEDRFAMRCFLARNGQQNLA